MVLTKNTYTLISNQTITTGTSGYYISPSSLDLSGAINLEVIFKGTFNSSSAAGAKVEMFSDPSNSAFTVGSNDEPIDSMDVSKVSGTKSKPAQFKCSSRYVKFKVTNLGAYSITGCYVYAVVQTQ